MELNTLKYTSFSQWLSNLLRLENPFLINLIDKDSAYTYSGTALYCIIFQGIF